MPGALGLPVALETTEGVGDTEVGYGRQTELMSSVIITLDGLSDGGLSDGGLSDGTMAAAPKFLCGHQVETDGWGTATRATGANTDPSRMSVIMENVGETAEGVLVVKATEVGLGDGDGVTTTVVDGRTCNKGERTVEGRDRGDDRDAIAVDVSDEEKEETTDGDALEGLLSIVLSRLGSPEKCMRRRWAAR